MKQISATAKTIILLLSIIIMPASLYSQDAPKTYDSKPGLSRFKMGGYAHSGFKSVYEDTKDKNDKIKNNFVGGSINPILMYKQSDRLFFEAEFEGMVENGAFEWALEYANMSYIINDYVTIRVGQFLLPFGTFGEKLHPAWINRLATKPLGFGHDGIAPTNDVGVELRGAFYAGSIKLNYQAYVINGPQLKEGTVEPDEAGMLKFGYREDNNTDKTFGGRLGIFPFTNSSTEIGFSGQTGVVGTEDNPNEDNPKYEDVSASLFAVDFSFVKPVKFLKSLIDIKAQYNYSSVTDAKYFEFEEETGDAAGAKFGGNGLGSRTEDPGGSDEEPIVGEWGPEYSFENISTSYYVQLSIRPTLVKNEFFKNLEVVGRWSQITTPKGALWEGDKSRASVGLNYWFDWKTTLKVGYSVTAGDSESVGGHDKEDPNALGLPPQNNLFYIHWAMGF
jgi:hypothetical protein